MDLIFLEAHNLLVDVRNRRLIDAQSHESLHASPPATKDSIGTALLTVPGEFQSLLQEFPDVISATYSAQKSRHNTRHHIVTTGPPVFAKVRRLDPGKLAAAKAEFAAMEKAGIICHSNSLRASPLHMVPKIFANSTI